MSELRTIQKAVGSLLPEAREVLGDYLPPQQPSTAIASELFLVAFAMKPAYREGGLRIAQMYCQITGLNPEQVERTTLDKIRARADEQAAQ